MSDGAFPLLHLRRFGPFFVTQFMGALNDNVFKNALVVLLTFHASDWGNLPISLLANLAGGIFILPFFLFSATAGQLADKYDKALLSRLVKVLEIGIVLVAATAFWLHSLYLLMFCLFLLGLHSTLFGPVKYAILPQHLHEDELVGGNALIEAGTFSAILIGTILGGLLASQPNSSTWITVVCLGVACIGYLSSRSIPPAPAPQPDLPINLNPISETWRNIGFARQNRTVFLSILGISWFWLFGALLLTQFPAFAKNVLGGNESGVTLLLAVFTLGIGLGSMLCERLSEGHVEIGLVPLGSIGLTVCGLYLALATPSQLPNNAPLALSELLVQPAMWHVLLALIGLGLFGGFFIVPLYALMQIRSDNSHRARIIAANNIMNALFMVVGSLAAGALLSNGLSIPTLFGIAALCNAAVAVYIYGLVPEFLLRFIVWVLVHTVYKLNVSKAEHIPAQGPALLIANHVSFVDALIITAACRRPIRFVMDHHIFRWPILSFFFKSSKAIPIAPAKEDAAMMERAFEEVSKALRNGELVCIFPEGKITANGEMNPFRPGITRILQRDAVPVVPMALIGLWGSLFSRKHGKALAKPWRARPFRNVSLVIGNQIPPEQASPEHLQQIVKQCSIPEIRD